MTAEGEYYYKNKEKKSCGDGGAGGNPCLQNHMVKNKKTRKT